jgi:hypothetical protein
MAGADGPMHATVPARVTLALSEPAKVELPDVTFTLTLVTSIPSLASHILKVSALPAMKPSVSVVAGLSFEAFTLTS